MNAVNFTFISFIKALSGFYRFLFTKSSSIFLAAFLSTMSSDESISFLGFLQILHNFP